ncbi:MAG: alkaline phosphatase family protein [Chloroflexi bacterium]|nr:alkaline phosphatase family protein [Chloroflexota bacterium]
MLNAGVPAENYLLQSQNPMLSPYLPGGEFVLPVYGGRSIANLPATMAEMLGVHFPQSLPLAAELWQHRIPHARKIVLLILDAVGYDSFQRLLADEIPRGEKVWSDLLPAGVYAPLTSVFPSTTTAALTSLCTGRTPQEHGSLSFRLHLRQFGLSVNMITLDPVGMMRGGSRILPELGFVPEEFLAVPSTAEVFEALGIPFHTVGYYHFEGSFLSRIHYRGARRWRRYISLGDMWYHLGRILEENADQKLIVQAYWPSADSLQHTYGPHPGILGAELRIISASFQTEFLATLSSRAREETVFMLVADHGQVSVPAEQQINLRHHPELMDMLVTLPVGEVRAPYLYARQGYKQAVIEYVNTRLPHAGIALDANFLLQGGLFGHGPLAPETPARIGDVVIIGRRGYTFYTPPERLELQGRHGSLTAEEMVVPWLCARLDS